MTLNGIDIRAFAADDLRTVVGLCEQDAHVFDSTLEANLRLAKPDATEASCATRSPARGCSPGPTRCRRA